MALIAFLIGSLINTILGNLLASTFVLKIVKVSVVFTVSLLIYVILAHLLKIEYLEDLKEKIEMKLKRKKNELN